MLEAGYIPGDLGAFKKEGGKIKLYGDSAPAPSQPTNTSTTSTNVPEYLRPYYERLVGKAEALSSSGYQRYGGERNAGFSDLQNQAFGEAKNLGPASQLQTGTDLANQAGLGSLQAGQNYQSMATDPNSTQAYMSPYIQNALNPAMNEARRQADITSNRNAGQAAQAGAFGNSRFGLQQAETDRNLGTLQSNIYGEGMQKAFQNAQQAQQFGSTLGLQGYGQGLQAANTMGQLGQTQFGQQQASMDARRQAGGQQQALEQQKLNQQNQDFINQQNYNRNQLGWFSDILHGIPGSQSTQAMYQAAPSMFSQVAGLGLAGYGMFGRGNAEGGMIQEDDMEQSYPGLGELAMYNATKKAQG
jgi:hypothetical protein